jgi:hypothetical protein
MFDGIIMVLVYIISIRNYCDPQQSTFIYSTKAVKNTNAFGGHDYKPQLTLTGNMISAVHNPRQVYRALGMHTTVSATVRKRWNSPFQGKIHEMSTRHRSRLLSMATPVVEKVCRVFSGEDWIDLLTYICNNTFLHNRTGTHDNKRDRTVHCRDAVGMAILQRSSFVKHVVDSFNQVVGNTKSARDERRRILSQIALDFPYKIIRNLGWTIPDVGTKYKNRSLTRHMFRDGRAHAGAFTPGGKPVYIPHRKGVTISTDTIKKVYSYIMTGSGDHVQNLAHGTHDLVLSTGEIIKIPSVARKFLKTHLWANYARKHTDDNSYHGEVSRTDFLEIMDTATDEQEKCYSALDQIKIRCGTENFEAGSRLVEDICRLSPIAFTGYEETLKKLMTEHKNHCKNDLTKHLRIQSKCGNHCLTHLFGGQGDEFSCDCVDCDDHPERCEQCDQGKLITRMMQGMIDQVKTSESAPADTIEDLQWRLNKCAHVIARID